MTCYLREIIEKEAKLEDLDYGEVEKNRLNRKLEPRFFGIF